MHTPLVPLHKGARPPDSPWQTFSRKRYQQLFRLLPSAGPCLAEEGCNHCTSRRCGAGLLPGPRHLAHYTAAPPRGVLFLTPFQLTRRWLTQEPQQRAPHSPLRPPPLLGVFLEAWAPVNRGFMYGSRRGQAPPRCSPYSKKEREASPSCRRGSSHALPPQHSAFFTSCQSQARPSSLRTGARLPCPSTAVPGADVP